MVEFSFLLSQSWFILLFSVAATVVIFPLVFIASFVYDWMLDKYDKTPKVLLMLIATFLGVLAAVLLLEVYLEFTLPLALKSATG